MDDLPHKCSALPHGAKIEYGPREAPEWGCSWWLFGGRNSADNLLFCPWCGVDLISLLPSLAEHEKYGLALEG